MTTSRATDLQARNTELENALMGIIYDEILGERTNKPNFRQNLRPRNCNILCDKSALVLHGQFIVYDTNNISLKLTRFLFVSKTMSNNISILHHGDDIFTYHHLPKWVYRTDDYTMIYVATYCDRNKFLRIFDNNKEILHG